MPAAQHTFRTELFPTHHPLYWDARKRAFAEITWFEAAEREALETLEIGYDEATEDDLEPLHAAAEAAEWLMENPNATAILWAQGRFDIVEGWSAVRPRIEQRAIDLHRAGGNGKGA